MPEAQKRKDSFSDRLKELIDERKESGQTLRGLAKDLEVSLGVLSDWQNGNKTPRGDSIIKLAQYFEVSADYLLGLTNAKTPDANFRMVADYTGLTEKAVEKILRLKVASGDTRYLDTASDMIESNLFNALVVNLEYFFRRVTELENQLNKITDIVTRAKQETGRERYKEVYNCICLKSYNDSCRLSEDEAEKDGTTFEDFEKHPERLKEFQKYVDGFSPREIAKLEIERWIGSELDVPEFQMQRLVLRYMEKIRREHCLDDIEGMAEHEELENMLYSFVDFKDDSSNGCD